MSGDPGPPVTTRHMRRLKLCVGGSREAFRAHGLSWEAFLRGELRAADLEATGNPSMVAGAALAREEAAGG